MCLIDYLNPYAYATRLRRLAYRHGWLRSHSAEIPVISVGNLSMGGSGKSPMVMLIAEYLEQKGKRVAIVSRGYKRRSKGLLVVKDGNQLLATVEDSGDEAQMFAQLLPRAIVVVDENRVRGAREAKRLGAEIVILDDGFQHLRLKRDLNILLNNGAPSPVLPFGRSREPQHAARDADLIVASDSNGLNEGAEIVLKNVPVNLMSNAGNETPLGHLSAKKVLALSSIAKPERFHRMLNDLGAIVTPFALPDHAGYSSELVQSIIKKTKQSGAELIITTRKDAVKSRTYFDVIDFPVLVLHHKFEFLRGEHRFYDAIDQIL